MSRYALVHISSGDLLRAEVAARSAVGLAAEAVMKSGGLVPDALVVALVKARLAKDDCVKRGWVLDGLPRTKYGASALGCSLLWTKGK